MRSNIENMLSIGFLLFTAWSVLATSNLNNNAPSSGVHYLISDCVTPTAEVMVTVSGSAITSPPATSFTDFGFPVATLSQTVSGVVGTASRECTVTYGQEYGRLSEDRWLYSCFDNGTFKCSIYLEPR